MVFQRVGKFIVISSVAVGSFCVGSYFERERRCFNPLNLKKLPALPLFGTVSAATPIAAPGAETHVSKVSQIMKYGFPSLDNVRSFDDFVLSYDRRNRTAYWVFEHLTPDKVKRNDAVDRSKCDFKPDESIHPYFRADNSDYKKSGYDRGHLAAAGNHKCDQRHIEQTFYLSNIAPQVGPGFNRDAWNRLEKHVRKLTKIYTNVYCCTGPLYLPRRESDGKNYVKYEVIGAHHVAVPTHFYKVVVGETPDGRLEMESYVMPNQAIEDNVPLSSFQKLHGVSFIMENHDVSRCCAITLIIVKEELVSSSSKSDSYSDIEVVAILIKKFKKNT